MSWKQKNSSTGEANDVVNIHTQDYQNHTCNVQIGAVTKHLSSYLSEITSEDLIPLTFNPVFQKKLMQRCMQLTRSLAFLLIIPGSWRYDATLVEREPPRFAFGTSSMNCGSITGPAYRGGSCSILETRVCVV